MKSALESLRRDVKNRKPGATGDFSNLPILPLISPLPGERAVGTSGLWTAGWSVVQTTQPLAATAEAAARTQSEIRQMDARRRGAAAWMLLAAGAAVVAVMIVLRAQSSRRRIERS